jgi:transposase
MVFLDESGFLLIPNVAKTWAPVGKTPLLWHSYKRDRISAISGVTVSPSRRRLGLYIQFHTTNITGQEVLAFLRHLLRHLRGNVELLWDGGSIHRRKDVRAFLAHQKRLRVHRFPGYAPQLNPDEFVWTKAKHDLSNSTPKDIHELETTLRRSIRRIKSSQRLLWSCIEVSELPWT